MTAIFVLVFRILMALALYAFLTWAVLTLWRDLRYQTQLMASSQIPELVLTPVEGFDGDSQRFHIPEVVIGRDPGCSFPILNETVSSRHARLFYRQNQWWIEDLNSTNGTYLNDERLKTLTVIVTSDEIRCGECSFRVEILPKS
jgi:pSer/pThr/pTyr-binding forkhead associated (FHA) protein